MDYRELLKKYMLGVFTVMSHSPVGGVDFVGESLVEAGVWTQEEFDELCMLTDENAYAGKYGVNATLAK